MRSTIRDIGLILLAAGLLMPTIGVVVSVIRIHRAIDLLDPSRLESSLPETIGEVGSALDPCGEALYLSGGMILLGVAVLIAIPVAASNEVAGRDAVHRPEQEADATSSRSEPLRRRNSIAG